MQESSLRLGAHCSKGNRMKWTRLMDLYHKAAEEKTGVLLVDFNDQGVSYC